MKLWTPDKSEQLDTVYSQPILPAAAGLVNMCTWACAHSFLPPHSPSSPTHSVYVACVCLIHSVELHYSSSAISAVALRSYCSLAMLNCPRTTQPHTFCHLAHSDGEKQRYKQRDKDGYSGADTEETGGEAGTENFKKEKRCNESGESEKKGALELEKRKEQWARETNPKTSNK